MLTPSLTATWRRVSNTGRRLRDEGIEPTARDAYVTAETLAGDDTGADRPAHGIEGDVQKRSRLRDGEKQ
jgi:hypothetical protein